jgi:hypothetical protein
MSHVLAFQARFLSLAILFQKYLLHLKPKRAVFRISNGLKHGDG